ncbi:acyl-CoA reductase [Alteromonas sp. ASW11-130]|uniref:acyl-CoA reductase n=1 Tax=Alteromonas sp. ASW11-130 TaxID=3015775 RepID=UPI002242B5FD|nr:acyl-CoA reductase [Alteromonas sp. ASW11-130]MCW8090340.1 hypothetical protein [Alteromonas sp. ASW11-130]
MSKSKIFYLANEKDVSKLPVVGQSCDDVLNTQALAFTSVLSRHLLNDKFKMQSEIVALGFWLRKSNLAKQFTSASVGTTKPIGLVVHYTPANVDTMFVYSWICSLVMGNCNVIRLNSTLSALQNFLLEAIFDVLSKPEFDELALSNIFVQYDRNNEVVANSLSQLADGRVLWGGDESVLSIRRLPIKPRCRDISFADRYSASLIDGDELSKEDIQKIAEGFYRDLHPFEQQACSSPKIVFWLGEKEHFDSFFIEVDSLFKEKPAITLKNEQLITQQSLALTNRVESCDVYNTLSVVTVNAQFPLDINIHTGNFTLWVVPISQLTDLERYVDEKLQTLTYAGIAQEKLIKFLMKPSIKGIDRVVPIGNALAFSQIWDGYGLTNQLTRRIEVQ